jgi:hypothetical protein
MSFEIRVRNWWKRNPEWPDGREPCAEPWDTAYKVGTAETEEAARAICQEWNATHKPGFLSRKAEYSEL